MQASPALPPSAPSGVASTDATLGDDDDDDDLARALASPMLKLDNASAVNYDELHRAALTLPRPANASQRGYYGDDDGDEVSGAGAGTGADLGLSPIVLTLTGDAARTSGVVSGSDSGSGGGGGGGGGGHPSVAGVGGHHVVPGSPAVMSLDAFALGATVPPPRPVQVPAEDTSAHVTSSSPDIRRKQSEKFPSKLKDTVSSLFHRSDGKS